VGVSIGLCVSNYSSKGWLELLTGAQYSFSYTLETRSALAYYGKSLH
jgi:hypothetical protein